DVPQRDHRARLERVQRGGAALEVAEQVGDVLASPPLEGEPPAGVARDLLQEVGEVAECRGERLRALLPQAVQERTGGGLPLRAEDMRRNGHGSIVPAGGSETKRRHRNVDEPVLWRSGHRAARPRNGADPSATEHPPIGGYPPSAHPSATTSWRSSERSESNSSCPFSSTRSRPTQAPSPRVERSVRRRRRICTSPAGGAPTAESGNVPSHTVRSPQPVICPSGTSTGSSCSASRWPGSGTQVSPWSAEASTVRTS